MDQNENRDSSLDLVRIFGLFSVISVHFFLNTGFYEDIIAGKKMYVLLLIRTFFMMCVPLFIVLSGYLLNKKTLCFRYYCGIFKTLITYFLASSACVIYVNWFSQGITKFTLLDYVKRLLNFSAAPYAWYIEMYLGLFMLIPFLNLIYHNLKSKRHKQFLVLLMILITACPSVLNSGNGGTLKFLPSWWAGIYPFSYYFIGCYLSEYPMKCKKYLLALLMAVNTILGGSFIFYLNYNSRFIWANWQDWESLVNVISTVLVFLFITNIDTSKWNVQVKKALKYVSGLCLGAYLCSWIFDMFFYPKLNIAEPVMQYRIIYAPAIVLLVFGCSLLLSAVLSLIDKPLNRAVNQLILSIQQKLRQSSEVK